MTLVWNFEGADTELEEERKMKEKKRRGEKEEGKK